MVRERLDRAHAGKGGLVVVEGELGIGKTSLLLRAAEGARRQGWTVFRGSATRLDRAAHLHSLLSALHDPAQSGDAPALDAIPPAGSSPITAYGLITRLAEFLDGQAARQPTLVVLDDAQWMDDLTALALRDLVPALRRARVLWLIGRRRIPLRCPGHDAVEALLSEDALLAGDALRLEVEPLRRDAAEELITRRFGVRPDPETLAATSRVSGNPRLLNALLDGWERDGVVRCHAEARLTSHTLPSGFADEVDRLLRDLRTETRTLLEAGAVCGPAFALDRLEPVLEFSPTRLLAAVDEATAAGVLADDGPALRFRHPAIRDALDQSMSGTRRGALRRHVRHPVLAKAGDAEPPPAADSERVAVLRRAADQIYTESPGAAADLLLRAAGLLPDSDPLSSGMRIEALERLATAGRLREAIDVGNAVLDRSLSPAERGSLTLSLALAYKRSCLDNAVLECSERTAFDTTVPERLRVRLLAVRAQAQVFAADPGAARATAREALALARSCGEPTATAAALAALSAACRYDGDLSEARQMALSAVAEVHGDKSGATVLPQLWLAGALLADDAFAAARQALNEAAGCASAAALTWVQPLWHFSSVEFYLAAGALGDADREGEAGLRWAEQLGSPGLAQALLALLAQTAVHAGDHAAASRFLVRAHRIDRPTTGLTGMLMHWAQALLDAARDRPGAAAEATRKLAGGPAGVRPLLGHDPTCGPRIVRIALRAGDRALAQDVVAATERLAAGSPGLVGVGAAAMHARALLERDPVALRGVAEFYRGSPRRLAAAEAAEDAGRELPAREGAGLLDEARDGYAAAGAAGEASRLAGGGPVTVPAQGDRTAAVTRPGWNRVTAAELRVVRLVAEGMSTRQIARALTLSPHTVDSHVRNVFQKVGVCSRVELVGQLLRQQTGTA
jgi:DNA-binding CsgD family transcriptional regulator